MKSTEEKKMNEWTSVLEQLPEEGQTVNIKTVSGTVNSVLFQEGRFWKFRKSKNVGHTWNADKWQSIERKISKKKKYDNTAMDGEYETR